MKIQIQTPGSPYSTEVDPGVQEVTIREAFLGVGFITEDGVCLSVCMRDDGYEVHYYQPGPDGFDAGWTEFKGNPAAPADPEED